MITVTATEFRKHLFEYLNQVAEGQQIVIQRNQKEIAKIVPMVQIPWQDKMKEKITICVSDEELIAPLEEVWDGYV